MKSKHDVQVVNYGRGRGMKRVIRAKVVQDAFHKGDETRDASERSSRCVS